MPKTLVSYRVVEEDCFRTVAENLLRVFAATRAVPADESRFRWLYEENPDGPATIWTLRSPQSEIVGFTACIPRRMIVAGVPRTCWVGADFSVLPKYRTLGLAIQLRRAAKDGIDQGRADFLYSHANERMALVHERAGSRGLARMCRMARLVTTRPLLERRVPGKLIPTILSTVPDLMLHAHGSRRWRGRATQITHLAEARFGDEYDKLFADYAYPAEVVGVRDAAYLQWRYGTNPLERFQVLEARRQGTLHGYLTFTASENAAVIKDLFPFHDKEIAADLLAAIQRYCRRQGLRSVTMTLLETHPLRALLKRGFYFDRPERAQMFVYTPPEAPWSAAVQDSSAWRITVGDRDV